ncbi:MAG: TolC family protein [Oligoflexia bacterium]|nr:TolC family protein [Oligoflexia bacterium]MBF0363999.1 TolC family protein [Oligoflexia bacterium]
MPIGKIKLFLSAIAVATVLITVHVKAEVEAELDSKISEEDILFNKDSFKIKDEEQLQETRARVLSLRTFLEQGLRENPEEKVRQYDKYLLEIEGDKNFAKFWYPQVNAVMHTENQRIGRFITRDHDRSHYGNEFPSGYLGMEIKEFNLFNWGKDHLNYENRRDQITREDRSLFEERINLRYRLIRLYFDYVKVKREEEITKEYVRRSTFLYRSNREKAALGRASGQQFYQARNQYLKSQQEYNQARIERKAKEKELSLVTGDAPETMYRPIDLLQFKELKISLEESLRLYSSHNFLVKDKSAAVVQAQRSYELALKENLPLPRFSLNLGSYLHTFDKNSSQTGLTTVNIEEDHSFTGAPGGKNVEIRASIDLVWNIFGEKGAFNNRERMAAYYKKIIANIEYDSAKNWAENGIRREFQEIIELEEQVKIMGPLATSARKQYEQTLDNYLGSRASFLEIKDALTNIRDQEILLERVRYNHLLAKLELAKIIGLEDFPGENFETLVTKWE